MYIYIYIYIYLYIYIYICAVSPANHLSVVADTFYPLRTHQLYTEHLRSELHKTEFLLITSTLLW